MACCKKFDNMPGRLEADVCKSLLGDKVKQLDWALGEIKRLETQLSAATDILGEVRTASRVSEYESSRVRADAFLAKLLAEKESR